MVDHEQEWVADLSSNLQVKDSATPKIDDFYWLIEQMIKWDNVTLKPAEIARIAESCYLPLYKT